MSDTGKFGFYMIMAFLKWFILIAFVAALILFLFIQLVKITPNMILIPSILSLTFCGPCIFQSIHQKVIEFLD